MKQVAFARIVLPSGKSITRGIVLFDDQGTPVSCRPLMKEEAFTEWRNETYEMDFGESQIALTAFTEEEQNKIKEERTTEKNAGSATD